MVKDKMNHCYVFRFDNNLFLFYSGVVSSIHTVYLAYVQLNICDSRSGPQLKTKRESLRREDTDRTPETRTQIYRQLHQGTVSALGASYRQRPRVHGIARREAKGEQGRQTAP